MRENKIRSFFNDKLEIGEREYLMDVNKYNKDEKVSRGFFFFFVRWHRMSG